MIEIGDVDIWKDKIKISRLLVDTKDGNVSHRQLYELLKTILFEGMETAILDVKL